MQQTLTSSSVKLGNLRLAGVQNMFCASDVVSAVKAVYYVYDKVKCNKGRAKVTADFLHSAEPLIMQVRSCLQQTLQLEVMRPCAWSWCRAKLYCSRSGCSPRVCGYPDHCVHEPGRCPDPPFLLCLHCFTE